MCRLVGIVASELTEFALCLKEAPRSLATLSREHPDGWGIAIHEGQREVSWALHKGIQRADLDHRFHEVAGRSRGRVLVSHIRQKTVGPTSIENTHPFERDGWIFAHNGTVKQQTYLRERISASRTAQITGDTDSEALFSFFLTRLDAAKSTVARCPTSRDHATAILAGAAAELRHHDVGAFNFVMSDGETTFVHRYGRSLFMLERRPGDPVRERRELCPDTTLVTKWTPRRHAILVASERITDEPWEEIREGSFLRIDRDPQPTVHAVADCGATRALDTLLAS